MHDVTLVRAISKSIVAENDPIKANILLDLLSAVIRENHEEVRLRLEYLREYYAFGFTQGSEADSGNTARQKTRHRNVFNVDELSETTA